MSYRQFPRGRRASRASAGKLRRLTERQALALGVFGKLAHTWPRASCSPQCAFRAAKGMAAPRTLEQTKRGLSQHLDRLAPGCERISPLSNLVGAWPLGPCSARICPFIERVQAYMHRHCGSQRCTRVGSIRTRPTTSRPVRCSDSGSTQERVPDDFRVFQKRISDLGMVNSLAETLVKIGAVCGLSRFRALGLQPGRSDNRRGCGLRARRQLLADLNSDLRNAETTAVLWW